MYLYARQKGAISGHTSDETMESSVDIYFPSDDYTMRGFAGANIAVTKYYYTFCEQETDLLPKYIASVTLNAAY